MYCGLFPHPPYLNLQNQIHNQHTLNFPIPTSLENCRAWAMDVRCHLDAIGTAVKVFRLGAKHIESTAALQCSEPTVRVSVLVLLSSFASVEALFSLLVRPVCRSICM